MDEHCNINVEESVHPVRTVALKNIVIIISEMIRERATAAARAPLLPHYRARATLAALRASILHVLVLWTILAVVQVLPSLVDGVILPRQSGQIPGVVPVSAR